MNNRERAVNEALQKLGDAHRFGRLSLADYRLQRRELLGSLRPGETETERNPLLPDDLEPAVGIGQSAGAAALASHLPKASRRAGTAAANASAGPSPRLWWLGGGVFVVGLLAVAGLQLTEPAATPGRNSAVASSPIGSAASDREAALDDASAIVEGEAQTLVDANDWQPAAINRWLMQWRALSPDSQRLLLLRPRLQELRDQARYRLSVNRALAAGDTPESSAEPEADAARASSEALQALLDTIDPAR